MFIFGKNCPVGILFPFRCFRFFALCPIVIECLYFRYSAKYWRQKDEQNMAFLPPEMFTFLLGKTKFLTGFTETNFSPTWKTPASSAKKLFTILQNLTWTRSSQQIPSFPPSHWSLPCPSLSVFRRVASEQPNSNNTFLKNFYWSIVVLQLSFSFFCSLYVIHILIILLANVAICFLVKLSFLLVEVIIYRRIPCVKKLGLVNGRLSLKVFIENLQVRIY